MRGSFLPHRIGRNFAGKHDPKPGAYRSRQLTDSASPARRYDRPVPREGPPLTSHTTLDSPAGDLTVQVVTDAASFEQPGHLTYEIRLGRRPILGRSRLGIRRDDHDFTLLRMAPPPDPVALDDDYRLIYGKRRTVSARANELVLHCTNVDGAPLEIIFRAYDDGIAFRYRFPGSGGAENTVVEELTSFSVGPGRAWIQEHDPPGWATPAYEAAYQNGIAVGTATDRPSWNLPALFEVDGAWVLLAEADLDPTYFGAHLGATPTGGEYRIAFPDPGEGMGIGKVEPRSTLPWETPWRVIVAGTSLATIVETNLITDLSSPSRLADTSWIRPGRVSWSWWSDRASPQDLALVEPFVDLAADLGWEYTLIDAHWNVHADEDIVDFVRRAREKGVGVWLWYNSGGPHNEVMEQPRDRMCDREVRQAEFAKLARWGVAGVKVDFFHSDKQDGIRLYWDILADAADARIMVNFHGCTVPRGWRRTWPHLMTMEGVRGGEQYGFDEHFPNTAVWLNTILPFTRNVVGPMDYTPVSFGDILFPHVTTNGHELALAVVFESGLLHYADSVASYRATPAFVQDLLRTIPAAWDETHFVDGYPGESVILARRAGSTWYLAGLNGTWEEKPIDVPLEFLEDTAAGLLVTDAPDGSWRSTTDGYQPGERFQIELQPAGGFLVRFTAN